MPDWTVFSDQQLVEMADALVSSNQQVNVPSMHPLLDVISPLAPKQSTRTIHAPRGLIVVAGASSRRRDPATPPAARFVVQTPTRAPKLRRSPWDRQHAQAPAAIRRANRP